MMLTSHVFPEFRSPHGYLRARVSLLDGIITTSSIYKCLNFYVNH